MTNLKKVAAALGLFLALVVTCGRQAQAATATNPAHEDLLVSFTANLSVKIDDVDYSSRTVGALAYALAMLVGFRGRLDRFRRGLKALKG